MVTKEQLLELRAAGPMTDLALAFRVSQFLAMEARLLDEERFREWFDLLDEDLCYWAPLRENRFRRDRTAEIRSDSVALFDETKASINLRLGRVESGMVWSEDPPTRHVYSVSNIECFCRETDDDLEVHSVFHLYRNRSDRDDSHLMGRRRDILRLRNGDFRIAGRLILLQQSTLMSKNLNVFF
ncbi:3-phenylpropionate/cinnamic acid dioxygenase subunit beta [Kordiimonas gwangyangensis]|uniref:3-phenylpropionate/cinnamic acid dioxygenase subunit beta n=1 Tax=Kordiimonas gwangyangensis TaxID=288022 RepID=UPI00035E235C|nr:3-phenylpropionate/cinnamic acid dioxygenase subunit beta [Kordiimonas gwangyangensis]